MNERMIELANKANEDVGYTFKLEDAKQIHELMGKFAELIVRECLVQIDDAIPDTNCSAAGAYQTAKLAATSRVKKHFGVK